MVVALAVVTGVSLGHFSYIFQAVGTPVMPPYWALGFQLCRWGYRDLNHLKEAVGRMRQYDIPHVCIIPVSSSKYQLAGVLEILNKEHLYNSSFVVGLFTSDPYYCETTNIWI